MIGNDPYPTSVRALGNRTAAGQFVQHANTSQTKTTIAGTFAVLPGDAITFAVAFASTPRVCIGVTQGARAVFSGGMSARDTTGFTPYLFSDGATSVTFDLDWIAIGG